MLRTRRAKFALLTLGVVLGHALLTHAVVQEMDDLKPAEASIQRMDATYVSEVQLSQPPAAPPAPTVAPAPPTAPTATRPKAVKPAKAASQPDDAASQPEAVASAAMAASAVEPTVVAAVPEAASAPGGQPSAAAVPVATAASAPDGAKPFVWPLATRVSYKLEGNFRGPIYGQAAVEWVRKDNRYQVHIDASIGPSFAPLGSWRLTSAGDIQPQGLYPRQYENVNRLLIKTSAPRLIKLDTDEVISHDGKRYPRLPDLQDPASFMIQLAYQFTLKPDLLKPGSSFDMSVVTLRKIEQLSFDVVGEDVISTPIGDVPAVHVRPRKTVMDGGALPADVWFAPGLQYLPVRIYIKMSEEVFMDMQMNRAPQQAPAEAPSTAKVASKP